MVDCLFRILYNLNQLGGIMTEKVQVEHSTRVVTLAITGKRLKTVNADGFFEDGEYSYQDVLQLIHHAQAEGWELVSTIPRKSADTGQQFLDMFFRRK